LLPTNLLQHRGFDDLLKQRYYHTGMKVELTGWVGYFTFLVKKRYRIQEVFKIAKARPDIPAATQILHQMVT
jgi:hypothetical protein